MPDANYGSSQLGTVPTTYVNYFLFARLHISKTRLSEHFKLNMPDVVLYQIYNEGFSQILPFKITF